MTAHGAAYLMMIGWQLAAGVVASFLYENWGVGLLLISVLNALHMSRRIGSIE